MLKLRATHTPFAQWWQEFSPSLLAASPTCLPDSPGFLPSPALTRLSWCLASSGSRLCPCQCLTALMVWMRGTNGGDKLRVDRQEKFPNYLLLWFISDKVNLPFLQIRGTGYSDAAVNNSCPSPKIGVCEVVSDADVASHCEILHIAFLQLDFSSGSVGKSNRLRCVTQSKKWFIL